MKKKTKLMSRGGSLTGKKILSIRIGNIVKLPNLAKVSSPQLTHKFFIKNEDSDRSSNDSVSHQKLSKPDEKILLKKETGPINSQEKNLISDKPYKKYSDSEEMQSRLNQSDNENLRPSFPAPQAKVINTEETKEIKKASSNTNLYKSVDKRSSSETIEPVNTEPNSDILAAQNQKISLINKELINARYQLKTTKELLELQIKKYQDIKILYSGMKFKTPEDEKIIESSQQNYNELEKNLKINNFLRAQLEETKNKMHAELKKSKEENDELKKNLEFQAVELDLYTEQAKKADSQRKRYLEAIKDLESEISALKSEKKILSDKIEDLSSSINTIGEALSLEKKKTSDFEILLKDIPSQELLVKSLNSEIVSLKKDMTALKKNLSEAHESFQVKKNNWRIKKKKFIESISDLNKQINDLSLSIQVSPANTFKPQKSQSIKDSEPEGIYKQETFVKLQSTISELQSSLTEFKNDNEKLKKNIEYYKNSLDTKTKIIGVLEEQIKTSETGESEIFQINPKDLKKKLEVVKTSIQESIGRIKCKKCEGCQNVNFIMIPCEHTVCGNCVSYEDQCLVCNNAAKTFQISIFCVILEKMNFQIEILQFLL
jgi:predicted  nucleic acid-binding Zn-ribbon protein